MATNLWLRDLVESGVDIGSFGERKLSLVIGAGGLLQLTSITTASGNHIPGQLASTDTIFLIQVNAVTISGTVTANLWGRESAMAVNAGCAVIVSRYDSAGTFVSDVVAQANAAHAKGAEYTTTDAVQNWTITPTSTTFVAGDWLGIVVHADAVGTMGAGSTSVTIDGATAAALGDSYVQFTETITQFVVSRLPAARVVSQAVARSAVR